ncbi:response regulator [Paenibacillus thalictri]|nr:response regulator [Paenibacillus thalictri]
MNLLIVDDEKQIREGIEKYVTKKKFGFKQITTAKDATEALHISSHFKPDLLITDIAMPKIDGIELATRMKGLYPDVKIVMITGFQEVKFMKQAFKLSVVDYILKPIDLNELNPVLERIISTFEAETEVKLEISSLKGNWSENIGLLRETYLTSLLSGKYQDVDPTGNKMKQLHIALNIKRPMVVVNICLDESVVNVIGPESSRMLETIQEAFSKLGVSEVFRKSEMEVIAVIQPDARLPLSDDSVHEVCCLLLDRLIHRYGPGFMIGIGSLADHYLKLAESYSASVEAVNQRFIQGNGHVISYPASYMKERYPFVQQETYVEKLALYILAGDCNQTEEYVRTILNPVYQSEFMSSNEIQTVRLELVSLVKQVARKLNPAMADFHRLSELLELQTLNEMEQRLVQILFALCEHSQQQQGRKRSAQIISKAKELTESRYNEPLNVQYVAECMQVSPNYFSTLFKQETGVNYMDYLTTMRLEKSLEMILSTTHRISEIACMVGYQDANYFAKIFKKHFGRSPSQYREGSY